MRDIARSHGQSEEFVREAIWAPYQEAEPSLLERVLNYDVSHFLVAALFTCAVWAVLRAWLLVG